MTEVLTCWVSMDPISVRLCLSPSSRCAKHRSNRASPRHTQHLVTRWVGRVFELSYRTGKSSLGKESAEHVEETTF
ncbi:hypothetical protein M8818_003819 [Zalaria obscura]|uniref:Uncharacterized protein n=1 Tax=Zalaria obscura TaxID=2024903 RepID=A0ACC3SDW9_9PEZI